MVCGITAPYWYEQKINIMQVLDLILSKTKKSHIFPICFIFSWKISRWKYFCGLETRYLWFMEWKLHTGINKKWFTCKFRFFFIKNFEKIHNFSKIFQFLSFIFNILTFCGFLLHVNVLCTWTQFIFRRRVVEIQKFEKINFFSHLSHSPERKANSKFNATWHTPLLNLSPERIKCTKNLNVNFRFYIQFYHVRYLFWAF